MAESYNHTTSNHFTLNLVTAELSMWTNGAKAVIL
jgi:hypothetical protein